MAEELQELRLSPVEGDMRERVESEMFDNVPKNTARNNKWCYRIWNEWASNRNKAQSDISVPDLVTLATLPPESMEKMLCLFIKEVQKTNREEFPPESLTGIMYGIQRFVRQFSNQTHINFFAGDEVFRKFQKAYSKKMKELVDKGVGATKKQAKCISEGQELTLWDKGVFNFNTSLGMSYAAFFYTAKVFGLVSGEYHRALRRYHFKFGEDDKGKFIELDCKLVKSSSCRNAKGNDSSIRHYQDPNNPRTYYNIVEQYLIMLPINDQEDFYLKPVVGRHFSMLAIGENALQVKIAAIMKAGGFKDHYTNQSIMSTVSHRLDAKGLNLRKIKGGSEGLRHQHPDISLNLDPPLPLGTAPVNTVTGLPVVNPEVPYPTSIIKVEKTDSGYDNAALGNDKALTSRTEDQTTITSSSTSAVKTVHTLANNQVVFTPTQSTSQVPVLFSTPTGAIVGPRAYSSAATLAVQQMASLQSNIVLNQTPPFPLNQTPTFPLNQTPTFPLNQPGLINNYRFVVLPQGVQQSIPPSVQPGMIKQNVDPALFIQAAHASCNQGITTAGQKASKRRPTKESKETAVLEPPVKRATVTSPTDEVSKVTSSKTSHSLDDARLNQKGSVQFQDVSASSQTNDKSCRSSSKDSEGSHTNTASLIQNTQSKLSNQKATNASKEPRSCKPDTKADCSMDTPGQINSETTNKAEFQFVYKALPGGSAVSQEVVVKENDQSVFSSSSTHKQGRTIPDFDMNLADYVPTDCALRPEDITIKRVTTTEGTRMVITVNYPS